MIRRPQHRELGTVDGAVVCGNVPRMAAPEHRSLALLLQHLSWQDAGLKGLAEDLVHQYAARIGTETMRKLGTAPGRVYTERQAADVQWELFNDPDVYFIRHFGGDFKPSLDATALHQKALDMARRHLAADLRGLAEATRLQPPCYFRELLPCLSEWADTRRAALAADLADTAQARQVMELIKFAFGEGGVAVGLGLSGTGKSAVAKNWCSRYPERARYVEVPETDDLRKLQRAVAHAIGIHGWLDFPADRLAAEASEALKEGGIGLVLDEAHRMWPAARRKPSRVEWVHGMMNIGIPMLLLGIGKEFQAGMIRARQYGYAVPQFNKRRELAVELRADVDQADLCRVLAKALPELGEDKAASFGLALAGVADVDETGFGAVAAVAKHARYLAEQDGKAAVLARHVECAAVRRLDDARLFDPKRAGHAAQEATPRPPTASVPAIAGRSTGIERPVTEALQRGGRGSAAAVMGSRIAAPADSLTVA